MDDDDDGDESEEGGSRILALWTQLKTRLMPHLVAQVAFTMETGVPLSVRAIATEIPEEPDCGAPRSPIHGRREPASSARLQRAARWSSISQGAGGPRSSRTRSGLVLAGFARGIIHRFATLPLHVREGGILVLGSENGPGATCDYAHEPEGCLYEVKP